jgi:hypothetical protein
MKTRCQASHLAPNPYSPVDLLGTTPDLVKAAPGKLRKLAPRGAALLRASARHRLACW